jgi:hypothetical protein
LNDDVSTGVHFSEAKRISDAGDQNQSHRCLAGSELANHLDSVEDRRLVINYCDLEPAGNGRDETLRNALCNCDAEAVFFQNLFACYGAGLSVIYEKQARILDSAEGLRGSHELCESTKRQISLSTVLYRPENKSEGVLDIQSR